jgi:hypothetical protein
MDTKYVTFSGFVTTTDPIPKYNGRSLSPEVMYLFADAIRANIFPMGIEHDGQHRLHPQILSVEVRETETGSLGVWVESRLEEKEWEMREGKFGFSVTFDEVLLSPHISNTKPRLVITVSALSFEMEALRLAVQDLEPYFAVEMRQRYELSDITLVQVLIEIGVGAVSGTLAAGATSAIKAVSEKFIKNREGQETKFIFKQGDTEVTVQTSDPAVVRRLIESRFVEQGQIASPKNRRGTLPSKKRRDRKHK